MIKLFSFRNTVIALILATGVAFSVGWFKANGQIRKQLEADKIAAVARVVDLERQNSKIKEKVTIKYVNKVKTIKEKEFVYVDAAGNLINTSELPNGWVYIHDATILQLELDEIMANDPALSGFTAAEALKIIVTNYGKCLQNAEQLTSLQQWIKETQEAVNNEN